MMECKKDPWGPVRCMAAYGYMAVWIALSTGIIMLNKYILAPDLGGFPFPLTLTSIHMLFCSTTSWLLVKAKLVEVPDMPIRIYVRCVVPIGVLFAVMLWTGNAAYVYLSVSSIQMLKAVIPMLVFAVGTMFGTERWSSRTGCTLVAVVGGAVAAAYGEVVFMPIGVVYQCTSLVTEALRLTLMQLLLQRQGFKLNPITTMYLISPICLMALLIPCATLEAEQVLTHHWKVGPSLLLGSAATAFGLNCIIFLLIGSTSALTLSVGGVVKDVVLVYLSVTVYGSTVTKLQAQGYFISLVGVLYYNSCKLAQAKPQLAKHLPTCEDPKAYIAVQATIEQQPSLSGQHPTVLNDC